MVVISVRRGGGGVPLWCGESDAGIGQVPGSRFATMRDLVFHRVSWCSGTGEHPVPSASSKMQGWVDSRSESSMAIVSHGGELAAKRTRLAPSAFPALRVLIRPSNSKPRTSTSKRQRDYTRPRNAWKGTQGYLSSGAGAVFPFCGRCVYTSVFP